MESAEPAVRRSGDMELSAFDLVILQYLVQKIRENPIPAVIKEKLVCWGRWAHDNVAALFGFGLPRSFEQEPWVISSHFKKVADNTPWKREACSAR